MNTIVTVKDQEIGSAFVAWVEQRVLLTLSRYGGEILEAGVTVTDDNGPRGGVDKRCRVTLTTRSFGSLSFVSVAVGPHYAVMGAMGRARRCIHRKLAMRRDRRLVLAD